MDRLFKPIIRKPTRSGVPLEQIERTEGARKGQGMVEFALVLPLLLLLVFGIMELGRLLVIYSSVQAASREGARYGSASGLNGSGQPYYQDTAGIRAAARRIGVLINLPNDQIDVELDPPLNGEPCPNPNVPCRKIIVTVTADYNPLLGLTPLQPFTFESVARRTIVEEVAVGTGTGGGGGGGGGGGTTDYPPTVLITIPGTCPHNILLGDELELTAVATDGEDGDLTSVIVWKQGETVIGGCSGENCSIADLSAGNHTIRAEATDSEGNTSQDTCIVYVEPPPEVVITAPANDAHFYQGVPVTFTGTASEYSSGDLNDLIQWTSSINGSIGSGASFSRSDLALGLHTITATVTDSDNQTGSDTISIVIEPNTPQLSIVSPADGASFVEGVAIVFSGNATDANGVNMSSSIAWYVDGGNYLGTGASVSTSGLGVGDHIVTASITELGVSATITIHVVVNAAPVVTIASPPNGGSYSQGTMLTFTGTAIDDLDGNLSNQIHWSSSGGQISHTGSSFQFSSLPAGTHTIYAEATDSRGVTGSASITITIVNEAPVVTIDAPTTNTYVSDQTAVNFRGTATDNQDGLISHLIRWSSSVTGGSIGSGASITTTLAMGTHTITAAATDAGGATGSATTQLIVWKCPYPNTPSWTYGTRPTITWTLNIDAPPRALSYILNNLHVEKTCSGCSISSVTVNGVAVPAGQRTQTATALDVTGPVGSNLFASPSNTVTIIYRFLEANRPTAGDNSSFTLTATFQGCSTFFRVTEP